MAKKTKYNVYKVKLSFCSYELYDVYVGAESPDDVIEHIKDIFPDYKEDISEVSDADFERYDIKVVDNTAYIPYFDKEQMGLLLKQKSDRIEKVAHMYTDKPYCILSSSSYVE